MREGSWFAQKHKCNTCLLQQMSEERSGELQSRQPHFSSWEDVLMEAISRQKKEKMLA